MAPNKQDAVSKGPASAKEDAQNKGPEAAREGAQDKKALIRERDEALARAAEAQAVAEQAMAVVQERFGRDGMALAMPQTAGKTVRVQFTRAYSFAGFAGVKSGTFRVRPFHVKEGEIRDVPEELIIRIGKKYPNLMQADPKKWEPRKIVAGRTFNTKTEKWEPKVVTVSVEDLEENSYVVGYPRQ